MLVRHKYDNMANNIKIYALLSDQELVERLTAIPADEKLFHFFLTKICRKILRHISANICNNKSEKELWGEFYEFISNNDWDVLRKWKNRNGASLSTYLAYCTTNHFVRKQLKEKQSCKLFVSISSQETYEQFAQISNEEERHYSNPQIWKAFNMLNERDRTILQLLVIDGHSIMEAAPQIWEYIKSKSALNETDPKRVQCTIAMAKHRAQLALFNNLKKTEKGIY